MAKQKEKRPLALRLAADFAVSPWDMQIVSVSQNCPHYVWNTNPQHNKKAPQANGCGAFK
ncbi:hypothetical protein PSA5_07005 [Pseudomonas syringae pv. actinidiae]|nr:hypothetical protein PSA5_07005 [Pseudomonas syringae pv. actinidiae]